MTRTDDTASAPGPRRLSHALVALQFAGIALTLLAPADAAFTAALWPVPLIAGPALFALGVLLGGWTLLYNRPGNFNVYPEIRRDARLITGGPYRYARHPMYGALLLTLAGVALYRGGAPALLGLALVAVAVGGKARREETLLARRFPDYPVYAAGTRRFVPWLF